MRRLNSSLFSRSALGLGLVSALSLSSCSKVNDMHDATMDMSKTTKGMADTTDKMAKTTDHMSETTDHMSETTDGLSKKTDHLAGTTDRMDETTCKMYTSLRQGNAKVSRDTDMQQMLKSKDITEKLELSAKYMQGFEYQVWAPSCSDVAPRELTIDQAATELLTAIQPLAKDRSNVTATSQSSDYGTLYAMAATLHRINELQAVYLAKSDEKVMTLEDVLVQGLEYNQKKNRGELTDSTFPLWATTVGKYEKDSQFLLRLRGNFLMAYGYAVADSDAYGDSPGLLKKLWRLKMTSWFSSKWTPSLESRDATEIHERITVSLQLAKATHDSLVRLGIDPMTDQSMVAIWKDADFSKFNLKAMAQGKGDDPSRAKAIAELISARDALLASFAKK
jgi:hypothetical protein